MRTHACPSNSLAWTGSRSKDCRPPGCDGPAARIHAGAGRRLASRPALDERGDSPAPSSSSRSPASLKAIEALPPIGEVDVFGRSAAPRPSRRSRWQPTMASWSAARPPSTRHVTAKAIGAWVCGCVPLWRGDDTAGILNRSALVKLEDCATSRAFVARVQEVEIRSQRVREGAPAIPLGGTLVAGWRDAADSADVGGPWPAAPLIRVDRIGLRSGAAHVGHDAPRPCSTARTVRARITRSPDIVQVST